MDYELRIVVEKVVVSSQEVVKRDPITSYALQCPTSIVELGLRHGEQISLLAKSQDILLTEQSVLIDHDTHVCPTCGNPLKKNGYNASDFHAVFSDHPLHIQKHLCSNPDCRWHSTPTIKSLFGSNIHPDLALLHCEQGAWYSYREAEKNLETWNREKNAITDPRASRIIGIAEVLGVSADYLLGLQDTAVIVTPTPPAPAQDARPATPPAVKRTRARNAAPRGEESSMPSPMIDCPRGRRRLSTARLLCTLLLLAGCSSRSGIERLQDVARDGSLQPGISTKKDVYQRLGQPVDVLPVEDGSTWLYAQAGKPAGGLFTSGTTVAVTLATLHFDAGDLYQRVDASRDRRAQPRGNGTGGTPLGDGAAAHVREEMQRLGLPFDEAVWDADAKAHRLWTQPSAAPE